jgi:hypothetical protein
MQGPGARQPQRDESGVPPSASALPDSALSAGSPALAALMLSLGRLVLTRLVLTRGRRGGTTGR